MKKAIIGIAVVVLIVTFVTMYSSSQQQHNPEALLARVVAPTQEQTQIDPEVINLPQEQPTEETPTDGGTTTPTQTEPEQPQLDSIAEQFAAFNAGTMAVGNNNEDMFEYFGDNMLPDNVIAEINKLRPQVLRFPGGELGNEYDIDRSGYGRGLAVDEGFAGNHLDRFINMVQRLDYEPEVYVVLSLKRHFPNSIGSQEIIDDNMRLIDALVNAGLNVTVFELGNELYDKPEVVGIFKWHAPTVFRNTDKYLSLARQYTQRIKAKYPNMKAAVPWGNVRNQTHFFWDLRIVQNGLDFVDIVVPHTYGLISDNCKTSSTTTDAACAEQDILQSIQNREEEFAWLKQNTDLEIAPTEFSGIHFQQHAASFPDLAGSDLQRRMNLEWLKMFKRYDVVAALHHKLVGNTRQTPYNIITYDKDTGEVERTPLFMDFEALNR